MSLSVSSHRNFATDLKQILDHYQDESGPKLTDDFPEEFHSTIRIIRENPAFFPRCRGKICRANLKRFPYHMLFEIQLTSVWIFVRHHHHRDPNFGYARLL
jgi:plasmid stabilization system protein ParE